MVRYRSFLSFVLAVSLVSFNLAEAAGNTNIQSFSKAKRLLHKDVYQHHRTTLYCNASYGSDKSVDLPEGFETSKHVKRSRRIEWEHVVPAENFGRNYVEWREGHAQCVNRKGKTFRGRKCAEKVLPEYRLMQADMHNLFPAIGAVNALRSNYNFTLLPQEVSDFGSCAMKIDNRKAEPPTRARGRIARTYLYMAETYPQLSLSKKTQQLMQAWHKSYPVEAWECSRSLAIERLQGNANHVVNNACGQRFEQQDNSESIATR